MKYTATSVEIKTPDWKIVTATGLDGLEIVDGSLNRTDKKTGAEFPHYNDIVEGASFEADAWHNPSGKWYFFAPKAKTSYKTAPKSGAVEAAKITQKSVESSQGRKEESIKVSSTMRAATDIALASIKDTPFPTDLEFQAEWEKWRNWYLKKWQDTEGKASEPFQ